MTQYDLMKTAESILRVLETNKVDIKDVRYLHIYDEFIRLKGEGHKISYITYYLSQQYDIGQATVYRVVKRMESKMAV